MADQIAHNTYFDGKVQSLGLETPDGKATVGVMKKGAYRFSTSSAEKMVVVAGTMNIKLADSDWEKFTDNQHFDVAANSAFEIVCDADVAYICYYA